MNRPLTAPRAAILASPARAATRRCLVLSVCVHLVEIYFSIVERKVLTPNDFPDLAEVERQLLDFERRYEQAARPFAWKFTRQDLAKLLRRLKLRSTAA